MASGSGRGLGTNPALYWMEVRLGYFRIGVVSKISKFVESVFFFFFKKQSIIVARCPCLVVKADDSQSRGCGFKPQHRILDEKQAKLAIALKNKEIKVAKWGEPKKKDLKNNKL